MNRLPYDAVHRIKDFCGDIESNKENYKEWLD